MSPHSPHNTIINSIARAKLRPLGILQKGRSRFWYDDRRWHAIALEFQPSGFSEGTYFNLAVSWLWYPKGFWSFDLPIGARPWVEFRNETQFQRDFEALVEDAMAAMDEIRASTGTLHRAYARVLKWTDELPRRGGWPAVHLGLLAALAGRPDEARELLCLVAGEREVGRDWEIKQRTFCQTAICHLGSVEGLRVWIEENIAACRNTLGMDPLAAPVLPLD